MCQTNKCKCSKPNSFVIQGAMGASLVTTSEFMKHMDKDRI